MNSNAVTIGLDLGDRRHHACVLSATGEILAEEEIPNTRECLGAFAQRYPAATIVMETGTHSPWVSRLLEARGHRVLVANARKLRAISQSHTKNDAEDARMLAATGARGPRVTQPDQAPQRTGPAGIAADQGARSAGAFARQPDEQRALPLKKPRAGRARRQQGDDLRSQTAAKAGNVQLRCLLVNCAHYILGPFGPPSRLREAGERIALRGGKSAKKRAVIAVARKLAVTLLALWKNGAEYQALPQAA